MVFARRLLTVPVGPQRLAELGVQRLQAQEDSEHDLRMERMAVNIEKMRLDMQLEQRKMVRQTWSVAISAIGIVVAAFAAGATWWNYLGKR